MLITLLQPLVVVETTSSEVPTMTGNYTADIESSDSTIIAATLLNAAPMSNTNALIPGWYALASTNFCWRVADLHITRSPRAGRAARPPAPYHPVPILGLPPAPAAARSGEPLAAARRAGGTPPPPRAG